MIRIKTVSIEEFRGIRNLNIALAAKNFGICGPNGTGKSGIVDAIEFCLTGDVTRLSGQGSTGLSVRSHAPHVDQRTSPEKAIVTITANIPSVGKDVTLSRSVKDSKNLDITPADESVATVIQELQTHPEFALSRREIVKYIITPPGRRSKDVQTLLRLDHLENLRQSLTTFANKCRSKADETRRVCSQAESDIKVALGVENLERPLVLEKANIKRRILGLPDLTELTSATSFKSGDTPSEATDEGPILSKAIALADLDALKAATSEEEPDEVQKYRQDIKTILEKLKSDEQAFISAQKHQFISAGYELITEDACPLCDLPWSRDELQEYLHNKLINARETKQSLSKLREATSGLLSALTERITALTKAVEHCGNLDPPIAHVEIKAYLEQLEAAHKALKKVLQDHTQAGTALEVANWAWWTMPEEAQAKIDECRVALDALPDNSEKNKAREFLTVLQDRYERLLRESKSLKHHNERSEVAQKTLEHYNQTVNVVLEKIYDQVAEDFSKFYRAINHEDENEFTGKLTPQPAKLTFDVDFYGRGTFPPGAYHSEGHQDGMGLCLYLALMKHTLGEKFTFAVLDDVLMSVDTGHRREVCRLLKTEFPMTQFILTTHDRIWLQYMKTEGLVQHSQLFGGWNVDSGPHVWDDHDIWDQIKTELDLGDIAKAAWLLRHYLEYISTILADNLRARIEFRGDARYDLGDLLPSVLKQWRRHLAQGTKAAEYWGQDAKKASLTEKQTEAQALIAKTNAEQWVINPSVHFNEWANFGKSEFREVVDAFRALLQHLRCSDSQCGSYLYTMPHKGQAEVVRCNCGAVNINLKST